MFKLRRTVPISTDMTKKDQESDQDGLSNQIDSPEEVNGEDNWVSPLLWVKTPDGEKTEAAYIADDGWSVNLTRYPDGKTDITLGDKLFEDVKENFDYTDEKGRYYWIKINQPISS